MMDVRHAAGRNGARAGALAALVCLAASVASAAPDEAGRARRLAELDQELSGVDELLSGAYFRTVLSVAEVVRSRLREPGLDAAVDARRARLEVMVATAELALGRHDAARRSLVQARRADPALELHEASTSPRVLELWRAAPREPGASETSE